MLSVENRQANLSRKLARIANLLRTKVEIEIENQNRNLLASMNKRTQMQLRLQQTVEGLSVAAVSYYIVGLFYYVMQALESRLPFGLTPKVAAGMFVPVAILFMALLVRRIHKKNIGNNKTGRFQLVRRFLEQFRPNFFASCHIGKISLPIFHSRCLSASER